MKLINQKKGQVATFIIIGLVLLIIISIFLVVLKLNLSKIPEAEADSSTAIVKFIESCLESSTNEALTIASRSGGYTNVEQFIFPRLEYSGPKTIKIPLWIQNNEVTRPSIEQMEFEISNFIQENINNCLSELDVFDQQFDIEKKQIETVDESTDFQVTSELGFNQIKSNLYFPLRIIPKGSSSFVNLEEFEITINTNFLEKYKLASELLDLEIQKRFLEDLTYESLVLSELPTEGMKFDCGSKDIYTYPQAVDLLQNIFSANMNLLRFKNTNYVDDNDYRLLVNGNDAEATNIVENKDGQIDVISVDDYYDYFNNFYSFETSNNNYDKLYIKTRVDKDSLVTNDFFVDPNKNNFLIEEMDVNNKMPIIGNCIKVAHHFYTFNYNIIFEVGNSDTGEQPFRFALPVRVERNKPKQVKAPQYNDVIEDELTKMKVSDLYCSQKRTVPKKLEATEIDYDLDLPIKSLDDVKISYECAGVSCEIGTIEKNKYSNLNIGELNFPECINGKVIFEKESYLKSEYITNTLDEEKGNADTDFFIQVHMDKLKRLLIRDEQRHNVIILDDSGNKRVLADDETVYITIRQEDNNFEKSYLYPFENGTDYIELIDTSSEYKLDIRLLKNDDLIGGYFANFTYDPSLHSLNDEILFYVFESSKDLSEPESFAQFWNGVIVPKSNSYKPKYYAR